MASKIKPKWPPAGWKVEIKVINGRKIKYYVNSKTRQKLYSKPAVLRYIKDRSVSKGRLHTTKKHVKKNSGQKQMHPVEANDSPWLPTGWLTEWRTRKSGAKEGAKYKCFIDPSTRRKFFSKPEVLRYLESCQGSAQSSGWKERASSRNSSSNRSVDAVSAHKSNLELKASHISKTRVRKSPSGKTKVVTERTVDEELPSGWVKEMRIKMLGNKVVRRDPFYTDPATGLVFRSKLEALRYLQTGEVSRHAFRRRNGSINDVEFATERTSATSSSKKEKTAKSRHRKQLLAGEGSSRQIVSALLQAGGHEETGSKRLKRSKEPKPVNIVVPAIQLIGNVPVVEETIHTTKLTPPKVQPDGEENDATLRESDPPSTAPSGDILAENRVAAAIQGCNNGKAQTSKRKTKDSKLPSVPSRSSKRLAGVDAEVVFHPLPIEHTLRATNRKSVGTKLASGLVSIQNELQEMCLDVDTQDVHASQEENHCTLDVDNLSQKNLLMIDLNDLQLEEAPPGFSENLKLSPIKARQSPEHLKDTLLESMIEKSPKERPVLEGQSEEQLAGIERGTQQPESELCFSSRLWSDPCLEFAYKTLTGAIQLDDNLAIQDYIQHQLRTSEQTNNNPSLPDMGEPGFLQNDETKLVSRLPENQLPVAGNQAGEK